MIFLRNLGWGYKPQETCQQIRPGPSRKVYFRFASSWHEDCKAFAVQGTCQARLQPSGRKIARQALGQGSRLGWHGSCKARSGPTNRHRLKDTAAGVVKRITTKGLCENRGVGLTHLLRKKFVTFGVIGAIILNRKRRKNGVETMNVYDNRGMWIGEFIGMDGRLVIYRDRFGDIHSEYRGLVQIR